MSDRENITAALDARFFAPLRRSRTRRVGVELELPVWNRTPGAATDFAAVHAVTNEFLSRFPFSDTALDDTGALYRARDPATDLPARLCTLHCCFFLVPFIASLRFEIGVRLVALVCHAHFK